MHDHLDIVVGDFGRPGTLRYLEAFSRFERKLVTSRLPAGVSFFDEHRHVQMVVLCQLRQIKRLILEPYFRDGRPLDEGILIGTSTGTPVAEIVPPLAELLAQHIRLAHEQGARRVRIVFPCNTIGQLAKPLEQALAQILAGHDRTEIELAPMQPQVAGVLQVKGLRSVRVLGTPACVQTYHQILQKAGSPIEVIENSMELVQAYETCIEDAIRGDEPDDQALAVVLASIGNKDEEPVPVLEACTDVSLGVGLDALEIYAEQLVNAAYTEAD
jgi:aspartate/glutamate racemase